MDFGTGLGRSASLVAMRVWLRNRYASPRWSLSVFRLQNVVFTNVMKFRMSAQWSASAVLEGGESLRTVDIIPELWSTRQVLTCSPWSRCGHPVVLEGKIVASRISLFLVLIPASSSRVSG